MPIDDLITLLRDHEVGLWCKRAAWLIALVDVVLALFQLLGILVHGADPVALVTTLLGAVANTLWQFFILYALGAIVTHLVRT